MSVKHGRCKPSLPWLYRSRICCRDSTGQAQDTGNVPASAAHLGVAVRPSAGDTLQRTVGPPGIVELASDTTEPAQPATRGSFGGASGTAAAGDAACGSLGGQVRGDQHSSLPANLASQISAMTVEGSQRQRPTTLIEEL